ncbi:ferritin-like domain-containing protein [Saliphagus sp. LR7]|uniref:ferritin-like domain-containing protein n=1 Tax=Saliphagus sp. LR7 TaxID=2282654 RepID=UPI000DF72D0B|nr:ferritin-like domain-containing protein [Saliphagus sp. LR7]
MTDKQSPTDDSTDRQSKSGRSGSTRRRFLGTSALLGAGTVAASTPGAAQLADAGTAVTAMDGHGEDGEGDEMNGEGPSDVDILNFALTLEYLEARFYREGLDTIGSSGLCRSEPLQMVGGAVQDDAFEELRTIQAHEEAHVEILVDTIGNLGGEPIAEPEFDFGTATENPAEFLQTAAVLETTGVGAYAGAAPLIENPDLIPPALGIHSVEARHSSFLNVVNGESGFPNAVDEALTMDEVLERAGPFIVE